MRTYKTDDLRAKFIGQFHDDEFAVFNYPTVWQARQDGTANDTTHLVLDFKDGDPHAIAVVTEWCLKAFRANRRRFLDELECRYVLAIPRSTAGAENVGCEHVAAALAGAYPAQLTYLPRALYRTETVPKAHLGGAATVERHLETIEYRGNVLLRTDRPTCDSCGRLFRTPGGLAWHYANERGHWPRPNGSIVMVDDVTTKGRTSLACRQLLLGATRAPRAVGFFVGKTRGW